MLKLSAEPGPAATASTSAGNKRSDEPPSLPVHIFPTTVAILIKSTHANSQVWTVKMKVSFMNL